MKKIIGFLLILVTVYILLVFKTPSVADRLEELLGIEGFNQFVIEKREILDSIISNTPSPDEIVDKYNEAYSGAIELSNDIKDSIDKTRDGIDSVRDTINSTREIIDETKETIDSITDTVTSITDTVTTITDSTKEITDTINSFSTGITNE